MNRKQALSRIAIVLGGTVTGADFFLSGCRNIDKKNSAGLFKEKDAALLDEIAETIIPQTDTPGAKEAQVGSFITQFVQDCYSEEEQQIFLRGLISLKQLAIKKYNRDFLKLNNEERLSLLTLIDQEAQKYTKHKTDNEPVHYFKMLKELTVLGYFTSKPGATQSLRFIAVPGTYMGCIPYKKGERAWAI